VVDGEAVLLGVDGVSDFNRLHSRRHDHEVEFYAFDMLVSDGEDLRRLPLSMRKTNLARLLARRVDGIHLASFEQGEIGPDLFRHACLMGLAGWSRSTMIARIGVAVRSLGQGQGPHHPAFSRVRITSRKVRVVPIPATAFPRLPPNRRCGRLPNRREMIQKTLKVSA